MLAKFSALQISICLHGLLIFVFVVLQLKSTDWITKSKVDFEVIVNPQVAPNALNVTKPQSTEIQKPVPKERPRQVFGVSRQSLTVAESTPSTAEIKQGNTVAKENDQLKLNAEDADQIPIPVDDYLVTEQVSLLKDVKIPYPAEAKQANIEGAVVMDLVIDAQGKVRSVHLIRGPGYGLNEAALEAVKNFLFKPARIQDQSVAVKIRYSYRFILENR